MKNIYSFKAKLNNGQEISMENYKGKALLIVNTASKCGFTPQYEGLEALQKKYEGKLEVLAFPCNQFGAQEPGSDAEILQFCQLNYSSTFPVFAKVDVNGENAHPIFNFLKQELPGILGIEAVKWNFTKFLVDTNGKPAKRFAPQDKPEDLVKFIDEVLK